MVEYDPYMPEIIEDPYPVYRRLRAESPVHYVKRFDAWALSLFEDIWRASSDNRHYSAANSTSGRSFLEREPVDSEVLASIDPPRHTRLRKELYRFFGRSATRALEPSTRQWATECIERHWESGRIDVVTELAQQVAVRVTCAIGGFPLSDADFLIGLVTRSFGREEGTEGITEDGTAAGETLREYLRDHTLRRIRSGKRHDDTTQILMDACSEGGAVDEQRVARHLGLLVVGATETTPKVFATGLLRLAQHPDQRRELCETPELIPTAATEILRYGMPTQWLGRTVTTDHEIRGQAIRAGQLVLFLYPSANRDEREFEDPDRFDIHRNAQRILTFGHGTHHCLGSFIARMEGAVLLEELLKRAPQYEVLTDELVEPPTEFVRGYSQFPIAFATSS